MDWTNAKVIEFIQNIETCPVLWDLSNVDYKNRDKKNDALQELAQNFNCDAVEVMRKWKIVLAQYRREKKNISNSKFSGCASSDIYKPKWFGYSYLNFLHGRDDNITSINSNDDINDQVSQSVSENDDCMVDQDGHTANIETSIFKKPKKLMKRRREEDHRIEHALSIMDNVNKKLSMQQDDDDIFGTAVAAKLRKIKDERIKIIVQRDIDNILYEAIIGDGKYSNTTSMSSPYSENSNGSLNNGHSENLPTRLDTTCEYENGVDDFNYDAFTTL